MTLYAQEGEAVKWKVLDDQTNTGEEGLFLFADKHLGQSSGSVYHRLSSWGEPFPEGFDYSDTLYRNWCVMFYENSLTAGEQSAVLATIKGDQAYETEDGLRFAADSDILSGEKSFVYLPRKLTAESMVLPITLHAFPPMLLRVEDIGCGL